jgi:hypothetical protein
MIRIFIKELRSISGPCIQRLLTQVFFGTRQSASAYNDLYLLSFEPDVEPDMPVTRLVEKKLFSKETHKMVTCNTVF